MAKKFFKRFARVNSEFDRLKSQLYKESIIAPIRFVELPDNVIKCISDINYIFNQMRLVKALGANSVNAWLDGFGDRVDTGIDTGKYTDEQLLMFIKDRNLQTPAELKIWADYLNQNVEQVIAETKQYLSDEVSKQLKRQASFKEKNELVQQIAEGVKAAMDNTQLSKS